MSRDADCCGGAPRGGALPAREPDGGGSAADEGGGRSVPRATPGRGAGGRARSTGGGSAAPVRGGGAVPGREAAPGTLLGTFPGGRGACGSYSGSSSSSSTTGGRAPVR